MKLGAGTETYHAWRIHMNDRLDAASWNNYGSLLEWSKTPLIVPGLFDRVQRVALETFQSELPDVRVPAAIVLDRAAYSVTVSRTVAERTEATLLIDVPDSISQLVADLHALGVPMAAPVPDRYLWVEPSGQPADPARDLNEARACMAPEARAMAQAIASGSLITPFNRGESSDADALPIGQVLSAKARSGWYLIAHVEAR